MSPIDTLREQLEYLRQQQAADQHRFQEAQAQLDRVRMDLAAGREAIAAHEQAIALLEGKA